MDMAQEKEAFLRTEYEFLAKAYEVHFSHFMGVFYFWVGVIGAPTAASAITDSLPNSFSAGVTVGAIWFGAGILGSFLTWKLYDLRASQFRYIAKMNELRARFWKVFKIEKLENVEMLGKAADLEEVARKDFGVYMARFMSLVNGGLIAGAVFLWSPCKSECASLYLALTIWLFATSINLYLYYPMVVNKIKEFQPKSNAA